MADLGGEQASECILGAWLAPGRPDCRQARACLVGVVPPEASQAARLASGVVQGIRPPIPLATKAPATPPGHLCSSRARTNFPSSPWTSVWASAWEVPLLGMPFPHFCGAWSSVTSSRKSSLLCSPGCTCCASGAQVCVCFKAWQGPGWGCALRGPRADPVAEEGRRAEHALVGVGSRRAGPRGLRSSRVGRDPSGTRQDQVEWLPSRLAPGRGARLAQPCPAGRILGPSDTLPVGTP